MDGLDTPLEVDTKIANALLGLATEAFVAAQLASRDASISALQGAKADATLLASYATNAALSASKTTLQSALDAILAVQLSGSGGVVNAPAWAGFTTWELVRGSSVVRNLHLEDPLSAALANGDDTLSITADCYSVAAADAALAAALLAYYTSAQVDALLVDYRTGAAQDAETTGAISAALLAYYTSAQVDALLADYRTASAQDTQTQAAIADALLAYRTGPDQDVFTTNQSTSATASRAGSVLGRLDAAGPHGGLQIIAVFLSSSVIFSPGQDQSWGGWMPPAQHSLFLFFPSCFSLSGVGWMWGRRVLLSQGSFFFLTARLTQRRPALPPRRRGSSP